MGCLESRPASRNLVHGMDSVATTKRLSRLSRTQLAKSGWLLNSLGWATARSMELWLKTLRIQYDVADPRVDLLKKPRENIYCLWHEDLLLGSTFFRNCGVNVMVSQSSDGEFIARTLDHLGFRSVRGSTGRGGGRAVLEMLREQRAVDLAITPDGPRGPRREFQLGAVYLASRLQMPLVPIGCGFERAWRMNSWDKLAMPQLFSRAVVCLGSPLRVPPKADAGTLEEFRQEAQVELQATSERAQRMAEASSARASALLQPAPVEALGELRPMRA